MQTENLSTLKIHKLTQEQYERELAAGRIDETALYMTPDEGIDTEHLEVGELVASSKIEGPSFVVTKDSVEIDAPAEFYRNLNVLGGVTIEGKTTLEDDVDVTVGALTINGEAQLIVYGDTQFEGGEVNIVGPVSMESDVDVNGTLTISEDGILDVRGSADLHNGFNSLSDSSIQGSLEVYSLLNQGGYYSENGNIKLEKGDLDVVNGTFNYNGTALEELLENKLDKTTYEYNCELSTGSTGKVCIGKFPAYDSNISVEIRLTTDITYHGNLIIATRNINTSGGGRYTATVHGDESGLLTNLIKIHYGSGSNIFSVYIDLPTYSRLLLHVQCAKLPSAPTDVATIVSEIPSNATIIPTNALTNTLNEKTVSLVGGVTGTPTSFGSSNITIPVTDIKESYLSWGGKNIIQGISPISAALSAEHSANRIAYLKPNAITIEYSNDAGATWVDSNISDDYKTRLVTTTATNVTVGSDTPVTTNHRTRIMLAATDGINSYLYARIRKMLINVSTPHGLKVIIEAKKGAADVDWEAFGTYDLAGWSAWNDIPLYLVAFGNSFQPANYWYLRLTFEITSLNSNSKYLTSPSQILGLRLFGDTCWSKASNMGETGHLYDYDYLQNAIFPAAVSATSFTENGVALSSKYVTSAQMNEAIQNAISNLPVYEGAYREIYTGEVEDV